MLEGADAARALEAVEAIAADLSAAAASLPPRLFDGKAGLALFFWHAARALDHAGHAARAEALIDDACEGVHELGPWLFGGYTGLAWLLDHIAAPGDEDPNEAIDEALAALLGARPWGEDYDLVFGLAGYARYALDRPPGTRGPDLAALVVARLAELAEHGTEDGTVAFRTPPELLDEKRRLEYPGGYYDLGLAHGAAGVLAVLCEMVERGAGGGGARALLEGGARWLRARHRVDAPAYPGLVAPGGRVEPPVKPGWCAGTPGIALTLLRAAAITGDDELRTHALALLHGAADRAGEATLLLDEALCHGHAGHALLLLRAAQTAGEDERLRAGARRAFLGVLDRRRPGNGIGGYDRPGGAGHVADPGLQTGAAGIGLALLAASTTAAPTWDRLFLLSGGAPR